MKEFLRVITVILCLVLMYFISGLSIDLMNEKNTVANIVGSIIMLLTYYLTVKSWFLVRITNYLINKFNNKINK